MEVNKHIPQEDQEELRVGRSSGVWTWFKRILLGILLVFLFVNILIQIPAIQNWAVKEVTTSLEKKLQTEVSIKYLHLAFFDKLNIEDVYIQNPGESSENDTLIFGGKIKVDFNTNPIAILKRGLEVDKITFEKTRFNLLREKGDYKTNIQNVVGLLFPPDTLNKPKVKRPFRFNIKDIYLDDVRFLQRDHLKGKLVSAQIPKGHIKIDEISLQKKRLDAKFVKLYDIKVQVNDYVTNPLPALEIENRLDTGDIASDSSFFWFDVKKITLEDGRFSHHNYRRSPVKKTPPDQLDYRHMEVFDIDMDIDQFTYDLETFKGIVNRVGFRDSSGFILDTLSAREASVSTTRMELFDMRLKTPYSEIGDTLIFDYNEYWDYIDFPDKVRMEGRFHDALVAVEDIIVFAPGLEENPFFDNNRDEVFRLSGLIRGKVNNLSARDLELRLDENNFLKGRFNSRNLAVRNEESANLRLEELKTSMSSLRQLIPNFRPPANYDRLGNLNFKGSFDGFFVDFVAYGDLRTDLGRAEMDMRMNLKSGTAQANYSGELKLHEFDLGTWTQNPDFDRVTFTSQVYDGVGLNAETASAKLKANVQLFGFKGYNYENARIIGELNKYLFDGDFSIQDENIDFSFTGALDFRDSVPIFDFDANVNKLDLKRLNLAKKDVVLAGDITLNLKNKRLAIMEGLVRVDSLVMVQDQDKVYQVDFVEARSNFDSLGKKFLIIESDVLNGEIKGDFNIEQIPNTFLQFLYENHQEFAQRFGIKNIDKDIGDAKYDYDFTIFDSKGINRLLDAKLGDFESVKVKGFFDNINDSLLVDIELPYFNYDQLELMDIVMILDAQKGQGELDLAIDSTAIKKKWEFSPISLLGIFEQDTMIFGLNYHDYTDKLDVNGEMHLLDSNLYRLEFYPSNLVIQENKWDVSPGNFITFGEDFIDSQNFELSNGNRRAEIYKNGDKGLKLSLFNFDFSFIDDFWDYDPLDFNGFFNTEIEIGDVFRMRDIRAAVISDTLKINGEDWGAFRLDAETQSFKDRLNAYVSITNDTTQLLGEGYYNFSNLPLANYRRSSEDERKANYFDFNVDLSGFSLQIADYFIGDLISDTGGSFGGNLQFYGFPGQPNVDGFLDARNGVVTIDFLQTTYRFNRAFVRAGNFLFDASGTILTDRMGNVATLKGGISHKRLKDFGLNANLQTERFLALDTKKGDNDLFYGQAVGNGKIFFSGSFTQPDIYVNAIVGEGTHISIPISYEKEAQELDFIKFVDKRKERRQQIEQKKVTEIRGVSVNMDLTVTESAEMELIFNEQAGDIIKGRGRGDIQFYQPRKGNFEMYGEYIIEQGDYLFTLYNVVNKDFRVKKGGVIRWTGDPYAAQIQLEAEYKDLKAPVYSFIQEYMEGVDIDLQREASQSTEIDLTLLLEGDLNEPVINFALDFPSLTGQLESYADSKLRLMQRDQDELNRQVFGLIVIGQFLPSDLKFQTSEIIYNTVSEFISNQLSLLLTELFAEIISDRNVLSGIDFDVAYNQYRAVDFSAGRDVSSGEEFQVQLKPYFLNNRLSVLVGGNIDFGNNVQTPEASGAFIGNDLVIEYLLNQDRSLKLRIYQRLKPDIGGGRRLEVGTGLSFRKEFDSFGDFLRSFRKDAQEIKEGGDDSLD